MRAQAVPRVCVFGGKAASSYDIAKRIVRLINQVGNKLNADPDTKDLLRVYFMPDYNVSMAETLIPGGCGFQVSSVPPFASMWLSDLSSLKWEMHRGTHVPLSRVLLPKRTSKGCLKILLPFTCSVRLWRFVCPLPAMTSMHTMGRALCRLIG